MDLDLKFDRRLYSTDADALVTFDDDSIIWSPNPTASRSLDIMILRRSE